MEDRMSRATEEVDQKYTLCFVQNQHLIFLILNMQFVFFFYVAFCRKKNMFPLTNIPYIYA